MSGEIKYVEDEMLTKIGTMASQLEEVMARSRRIETGLHGVREHMGLVDTKIEVLDATRVKVTGLDMSLSKVKRALQTENVFRIGLPVNIFRDGQRVAVVAFED